MSCQFGKQTKLPLNNSDFFFSSAPFDLVHNDVWGSAPFTTERGSRYFVIFVDDYARFTCIYMLKNHSDLVPIFQTFHKMIQTQFSRTIKVFRSDNAQEYHDKSFLSILDSNGTLPIILVPIPLNKMVVPNANFVTFLMSCVPFSYLPLSLSIFWVKRLSLPFTP